ncbi:MAG: GspE/PulE family protein, partial [Candidatus Omnitrophota bacterium]
VLPRLKLITQEQMVNFISENTNIPLIELSNLIIDPKVVDLVPEEMARKYLVVPVLKIGNNLTCVMVDVFNIYVQDELASKTGLNIEPAISTEEEIRRAIEEVYAGKLDMPMVSANVEEVKAVVKDNKMTPKGSKSSSKDLRAIAMDGAEIDISGQPIEDDAPVVKFVNAMITKAVSDGASDIHVEPEESSVTIRTRIDGVLHQQTSPPKDFQSAIISRLKIMAKLDIADQRKPQDGRIQMKVDNKRIDIRVSSLPTVYGENLVLRLLDTSNILLGLEQVGFQGEMLTRYQGLLQRPNGIILVTGPTGSGKTTTLYSSVSTINEPGKSIVTIEDPVEYRLPGIRQTQVNLRVDLTFANGLRAILRQDPNVIMIGEIRDAETAQIAIQAALTGHLVLATLHTNNAAGAITRLLDIGCEPFLLASSIIGVLAQRLVRLICKDCHGKGCQNCSSTGYRGRTSIFELMVIDEKIRTLALSKGSTEEIHRSAVALGMQSLRDNGLDKVAQGLTTKEEVYRVSQEE